VHQRQECRVVIDHRNARALRIAHHRMLPMLSTGCSERRHDARNSEPAALLEGYHRCRRKLVRPPGVLDAPYAFWRGGWDRVDSPAPPAGRCCSDFRPHVWRRRFPLVQLDTALAMLGYATAALNDFINIGRIPASRRMFSRRPGHASGDHDTTQPSVLLDGQGWRMSAPSVCGYLSSTSLVCTETRCRGCWRGSISVVA
jgi:hypothetical protein